MATIEKAVQKVPLVQKELSAFTAEELADYFKDKDIQRFREALNRAEAVQKEIKVEELRLKVLNHFKAMELEDVVKGFRALGYDGFTVQNGTEGNILVVGAQIHYPTRQGGKNTPGVKALTTRTGPTALATIFEVAATPSQKAAEKGLDNNKSYTLKEQVAISAGWVKTRTPQADGKVLVSWSKPS